MMTMHVGGVRNSIYTFLPPPPPSRLLGDKQIGILDESFEKEVWYEGEEPAIYMTIDVWHPDLTEEARLKL